MSSQQPAKSSQPLSNPSFTVSDCEVAEFVLKCRKCARVTSKAKSIPNGSNELNRNCLECVAYDKTLVRRISCKGRLVNGEHVLTEDQAREKKEAVRSWPDPLFVIFHSTVASPPLRERLLVSDSSVSSDNLGVSDTIKNYRILFETIWDHLWPYENICHGLRLSNFLLLFHMISDYRTLSTTIRHYITLADPVCD